MHSGLKAEASCPTQTRVEPRSPPSLRRLGFLFGERAMNEEVARSDQRHGRAALPPAPLGGAHHGGGGARDVPGGEVRHRPADRERLLLRLRAAAAADAGGPRRSIDKLMRAEHRRRQAVRDAARRRRTRRARFFADQPYKLELIDGIDGRRRSASAGTATSPTSAATRTSRAPGKVGAVQADERRRRVLARRRAPPMLQRIYGVMFPTAGGARRLPAPPRRGRARDHRRLGRELDLFFVDPIAPGSPFFLPKGAIVYNLAIGFMRELYTPLRLPGGDHAADLLRRTCGSAPATTTTTSDNMYFIQDEDQRARRQADELPRPLRDVRGRRCTPTASCRCATPTSAGCTASSAPARCTA